MSLAASDTLAVVRQVLVAVTTDETLDLTAPLRVDSLQALKVLVELEKRFEVEIDEVEMFADWFGTGDKIAQYLDRLLNRGDPEPVHLATRESGA